MISLSSLSSRNLKWLNAAPIFGRASKAEEDFDFGESLGRIKKARLVYLQAIDIMGATFQSVEAVSYFSYLDIYSIAEKLASETLQNPQAMLWLARCGRQDYPNAKKQIGIAIHLMVWGHALGIPTADLVEICIGALLHDIGETVLPGHLTDATRTLTHSETIAVRQHVEIGITLLTHNKVTSKTVLAMLSQHHERIDGSGYPKGLADGKIHRLAAMLGIVDSYIAMINHKPYSHARSSLDALSELYRLRGESFDGDLIESFIQCIGVYPVGSLVELHTQEIAVVLEQNHAKRLYPRIMVLAMPNGKAYDAPIPVDLSKTVKRGGKAELKIVTELPGTQYFVDERLF